MTRYSYNYETILNKNKKLRQTPIIKPIGIPEGNLQLLRDKLTDQKPSPYQKERLIKKITGGPCSICGGVPTKIVSYNENGASLLEKYCDKCIKSILQ
jgi:hypothetical protein